MTDDEKLELLDVTEKDYWLTFHRVWNNDDDWSPDVVDRIMKSIERCQRIRATIKGQFVPFPKPIITYSVDGERTYDEIQANP